MITTYSSAESSREPSIGSTILLFWGIALFLLATSAIVYSEFESTPRASTLEQIEKSIIDMSRATHSDEQYDGNYIFTAGELKTEDIVRDSDFNLHVSAIRLHRSVEIYQVVEKTESYTGSELQQRLRQGLPPSTTYYYQSWVDTPLDSSAYESHYRNANQGSHLSYASTMWQAPRATLGIYQLSPAIVGSLQPPTQVVNHRKLQLPTRLSTRVYMDDDYLYLRPRDLTQGELKKRDSITPQIGDLRLRWYVEIADSPWSLIGMQEGESLVPFSSRTEQHITIAHPSIIDSKQLLHYSSNQESYSKKTVRLGAIFLLWVAYCLITRSMLKRRPQSYFWIGFTERFTIFSSLTLTILTLIAIFALSTLRSELLLGLLTLAFSISLTIFIRLISISHGRSILRDQATRSALPRSLRY